MSYNKFSEFYKMNQSTDVNTFVHRLRPEVKILVTLAYIVFVASFGKYEVTGLLPFFIYPVVMLMLGELSPVLFLRKILPALPFVFFLGIFNPIFDTSGLGWFSFVSLLLKAVLTVSSGLLLIMTTGIDGVAVGFRRLRVPGIFVIQFIMVYRYISVLSEEVSRVVRAYSLRSAAGSSTMTNVALKHGGGLLGSLLLRTFDRSERIYAAMKCRGFDVDSPGWTGTRRKAEARDFIYPVVWIAIFTVIRFIDLPMLLGRLLEELL
jgi:cobalt/nickel transport system permease protein